LLGLWNSFDEIDFDKLPNKFVLKCTHGWDMNIIVSDKKQLDMWDAKYKITNWLKHNQIFTSLDPSYKIIPPRIIAEEYIENADGQLYDYKFWCFNGNPEFVAFNSDRADGLKRDMRDTEWNKTPFRYAHSDEPRIAQQKPANLEQMIEIAKTLSKDFYFARVDLYSVNNEIKFGEVTFYPDAGTTKWEPPEYDLILGEMLKLPCDSQKVHV
jgi:hypothetical protein